MTIAESLSVLLEEMQAVRMRTPYPRTGVSLSARMVTLDIFEMMILLDDLAQSSGLSGLNQALDRWASLDGASFVARLSCEPNSLLLASLLTIGPRGLAGVADHLKFFRWMEVTRAGNNLSQDQLRSIGSCTSLEPYLNGAYVARPQLKLPFISSFPLPSMLRVVQSARFRLGLLREEGHRAAMLHYARFFT